MERWTALPLLVLRGVVQHTKGTRGSPFIVHAGRDVARSAAGALWLLSSAFSPHDRSGQLQYHTLVSIGCQPLFEVEAGRGASLCPTSQQFSSGSISARWLSGNPVVHPSKVVVLSETQGTNSESTTVAPGGPAVVTEGPADISQSRSSDLAANPQSVPEKTQSAEDSPTEAAGATRSESSLGKDHGARMQQDLEQTTGPSSGYVAEDARLDFNTISPEPPLLFSVSEKEGDHHSILNQKAAASPRSNIGSAASSPSEPVSGGLGPESDPTTSPSSANDSPTTPAATPSTGRDSLEEPSNGQPTNSQPSNSSPELFQRDDPRIAPVTKSERKPHHAGPDDSRLGNENSRDSHDRSKESHYGEPYRDGSRHRRWTNERQLEGRHWPSPPVHVLAPVEYVTAKYGNLEITQPRKKVPAANLDTRPEGFQFSGMEVVFFGTSSNVPSLWRSSSCTAVRVDKSTFIIDCGDGSLQQLLRGSPFRLGSIERIFITHMHGDHVHGLAALLIFLGLRTRGANSHGEARPRSGDPDMPPIHIYGPLGLRHLLRLLLSATHASVETGYAVHELLPREEREQRARRIDEFLLPHADELPGRDVIADSDATWHVHEDANVIVKAAELQHSVPCFGYVIAEKVKQGRFDKTKAEGLGINRSDFGALQNGESRTLPGGRTIQPHEVMGPPRRGRKIVVLGDTSDASALYRIGWDCDLLIHEATVLQGTKEKKAAQMGHSTASMAGNAAREMKARSLVLTHISPKHQNRVHSGAEAARSAYGSDRVVIAEDYTRIQVGYEEEPARQRHVDALLRPQDRKLSAEEQWKKVTRVKAGG